LLYTFRLFGHPLLLLHTSPFLFIPFLRLLSFLRLTNAAAAAGGAAAAVLLLLLLLLTSFSSSHSHSCRSSAAA
jgi:hypothetical protein